MAKDITLKQTKTEIFQAFEQMQEKYRQMEKEKLHPAQEDTVKKEEAKIVEKTSFYSPENLESEIVDLRKKMQNHLDDIMNQLAAESGKLQDLNKSIKIESKKLEEIYNIQLAADTLKILISDYEIKQKEFKEKKENEENSLTKEMTDKRSGWDREREEYKYNLKTERKREEEAYEAERDKTRAEFEAEVAQKKTELAERESILAKQEQENADMKKQIERFPDKLNKAVHDAKRGKEKHLKHEFEHERKLLEQKWMAEKGVLDVNVNNLRQIIDGQKTEITSLKENLTEANLRAQNLAVAVVEGASAAKQIKKEREENERKKDKDNDEK